MVCYGSQSTARFITGSRSKSSAPLELVPLKSANQRNGNNLTEEDCLKIVQLTIVHCNFILKINL